MSKELIDSINKLTRDQAMESARFLCKSIAGDEPIDSGILGLRPISDEPYRYLPDVEALARLVLLSAAATPELVEEVQQAISGAERKQFILGGMEIVALAALGVVALKILVTGGTERTKTRIKYKTVNGEPNIEVEEIQEAVSISKDFAAILRPQLDADISQNQ